MRLDRLKQIVGSDEHRARRQALRSVALVEFAKGAAVLVAAFSLYWIDPSDVADNFLAFLHISPDHHIAHLLFMLADRLSNITIWHVVVGACCYSGLRITEAYGLWRERAWAEWIALISGAIYLPVEIRLMAHRVTPLHVGVFLVNVAIVIFMFYLRIYAPRQERRKAGAVIQ